jgi:hypothetical protein
MMSSLLLWKEVPRRQTSHCITGGKAGPEVSDKRLYSAVNGREKLQAASEKLGDNLALGLIQAEVDST